jgi:hypothetical protein
LMMRKELVQLLMLVFSQGTIVLILAKKEHSKNLSQLKIVLSIIAQHKQILR